MTDALQATDRLTELLGRKAAALSQVRELSGRQAEAIEGGDMSQLMSLLAAKQTMLLELQRTDRQLEPFRGEDPDRRKWRSPADRLQARAIAERCEKLLAEIVQLERQSEGDLVRRRDAAAGQLQGVHGAAAARKAYADFSASGASRRGLDLSSDT